VSAGVTPALNEETIAPAPLPVDASTPCRSAPTAATPPSPRTSPVAGEESGTGPGPVPLATPGLAPASTKPSTGTSAVPLGAVASSSEVGLGEAAVDDGDVDAAPVVAGVGPDAVDARHVVHVGVEVLEVAVRGDVAHAVDGR